MKNKKISWAVQCYLTCSNRSTEKSMKYQAIVLITPDNATKSFVSNE
ncbi:hypothetical protein [Candidatus Enterovibrio altilux]|nr:hypothetical protein [Candidatus Enterovibrio luxaltus]